MTAEPLTDALAETLACFAGDGEPLTTTDVADRLTLGRRSTYDRLERLADRDRIRTKKVGANARVWWRPPATGPGDPARAAGGSATGEGTSATGEGKSATGEGTFTIGSGVAESLVDDVLDTVEVAIFVLDDSFDVAWANAATERYFGLDRERALGRDKRRLVEERIAPAVADSTAFAETVLATYDDNTETERFECRVTAGADRDERWLEHRSKPIEAGAYAGGRVELYYDVTDRERTERAHRADREAFESMVDAVEEYAIFTLDADGRVETWNAGAERIKGYDAADVLGEHVSTFYTAADREAGVPDRNLAAAAERGSVEESGWRVREDGTRFWADVTLTAIRDDDGDLEGYAKVVRDMTERREYERELRAERDVTSRVLETAPADIFVVDAGGDVVRTNDRVEDAFDLDGEADSFTISDVDVYDESGAFVPPDERPFRTVFETGESVTDWVCQIELPSGERRWRSINVAPIPAGDGERVGDVERAGESARMGDGEQVRADEDDPDGWGDGSVDRVVVATQDVSRLKRQERRLERRRDELEHELEAVFDRVDDAFYALDESFRFNYVNDRAAELFGRDATDLLGRNVWEALAVPADDPIRDRFETAMATQESVTFEHESGPLDIWEVVRVYPSESGLSVYFTDVTERKERERELEESRRWLRTLVEHFPNGAVGLVDETDGRLRYRAVGGTPIDETGAAAVDLEGRPVAEALPPDVAAVLVPRYEAALAGEASAFEASFGDQTFQIRTVPVSDDDGEVFAALGMSQDVTEQKEYERSLRDAKSQLEAATEAGAVGTFEWHVPEDRMVTGPSFADTFDVDPDEARGGMSVDRFLDAIHEADRERVEREIDEAIENCGSYEAEYRVRNADDELRWVVARGRVECDDDGNAVTFPGAVTDITDRKEAERELARHKDQLEALNTLNEVVREITSAIVDQSTREEIEATVCERLAETDSYAFAWIGDVDARSGTVNLRTEAGVEGYLDDVTITVDSDDDRSGGPTGRALLTGEMQVTNDVRAESTHDPWRSHVEAYGFRSSAAIPIVHQGTTYGALNVYADRPYAFEDQEREVVTQLGEVVGHAIAAAERRRALLSDELVELEFEFADFAGVADDPVDASGPIALEHVVEVADDEFLAYGTGPPDAAEMLRALVDAIPHWTAVRFPGTDDADEPPVGANEPPDGAPGTPDDTPETQDGIPETPDEDVRFEARLVDPPVLSLVAARGGYVDAAAIENGDLRLTVHLAPSVDVRRVIDAVEAAYPRANLRRRRQYRRPRDDPRRVQRRVEADLTDRQSAALEAAYHAGFFEWPRESDGEDVAESLGVAPSTFHQHLRKAERKVFDELLSVAAEDAAS